MWSLQLYRVQLVSVVVLLFANSCVATELPAYNPGKLALLIGIDRYKSNSIRQLSGAVNDIRLMREVLIGKFGMPPENIRMLENEQATHRNIIDTIQNHLIAKAKKGDVIILHFSGHGSQVKDDSGDEIDELDETLVPYDSRTPGVFDITDDEINGLIGQLAQKTNNITLIFDTCHSGTSTKGGNITREIEMDKRQQPIPHQYATSLRMGEGEADIRPTNADYVLISGSLAKQLSNETDFEGRRHGVLTWFLASALKGASDRATYRDIMIEVKREVNARFPTQEPQLEGPGQDVVVFGVDRVLTKPYVLVDPIGTGRVRIEAGKAFGLGTGSTLKVFAPQSADFDEKRAIATVKVTSVLDFEADAEVIGPAEIKPQSRAVLEASTFGGVSIPVYVDISGNSFELLNAKEKMQEFQAIALVDDAAGARLVVTQRERKLWIQSGDRQPLAAPVSIDDRDAVQTVTDRVKDLIHWMVLLDLKNPGSKLHIALDVQRVSDSQSPQELTACPPEAMKRFRATGEEPPKWCQLRYAVHNRSGRALFIYVLDVSSDGSVSILYPLAEGEQQELGAGKTFIPSKPVAMSVPDGYSMVLDTIKVIATTKPIDPSVFPKGPLRRSAAATQKAAMDSLSLFLAHATHGTKAGTPLMSNPDEWNTAQTMIGIRRVGVKLSSFALHFADETEAKKAQTKSVDGLRLCASGDAKENGNCDLVLPIDKEGRALALLPKSSSRDTDEAVSVGEAFEEAYRIQKQTGAKRVEPQLELQVPGVETERGIDKRDVSGDDTHDPAAVADDQWNLKQVHVMDAWKEIRDRVEATEGAEAEGIVIAHPDTGYRHHPETWDEVRGKRPIDAANSKNYYEGKADAFDPLLNDRWLDNPGHGTSSGSVIVSPAGCQLAKAPGCVNGIARGAQLIPLRVHRTVSQFNTSYLAQAIQDVADHKIAGNPRLISIAMGGPPTFTMWRAVKTAEKNGVLIVAAAGNYVRTVVWPARFQSTIAVAAGDIHCRPWKGSSRGSAVDIMAPGESVWRATLNEKHEHINGMGKGTTFATGHVAGAAALWLTAHRNDPALHELERQGLLTQAFRSSLRASAWRPSEKTMDSPPTGFCTTANWDSDYGAGLLNIAALLEVPLMGAQPKVLAPAEEQTIPLFASLYPEGTQPDRIRADYVSLFVSARGRSVEQLSSFETELLYHYTVNEEIQRRMDAMILGQRGDEPSTALREALLQQDLSVRLRKALT